MGLIVLKKISYFTPPCIIILSLPNCTKDIIMSIRHSEQIICVNHLCLNITFGQWFF